MITLKLDWETQYALWKTDHMFEFEGFPRLNEEEQIQALYAMITVTKRDFLANVLRKYNVPFRTRLHKTFAWSYHGRYQQNNNDQQVEALREMLRTVPIKVWFENLLLEYPGKLVLGLLEEYCAPRELNIEVPLTITTDEQNRTKNTGGN